MAPGRTTRSSKNQGPSVTDHFLPRRVGEAEQPTKSIGDDAPVSESSSKRALLTSKSRVEVPLTAVEYEAAPAEIVPPKGRANRALFGESSKKTIQAKRDVKKEVKVEEKKEEEVKVPEVRSIIPTESEAVTTQKNVPRGPRSVADLQAELARRGAARIHEQAMARKLEQISERAELIKSPQKCLPVKVGGSPPKRARKENKEAKKRGPVKVLPVPEFVLPHQGTMRPQLLQPQRERSEEREPSPQEDSMTRAPQGYGSSLMVEEVRRSREVELPTHYRELHSLFKDVDQIVSFYDSRDNATLTLSTLLTDMQKRKKPFSQLRFTQLMSIYPEAYKVELGRMGGGTKAERWEYKIKPNLENDIAKFVTGPLLSDQPAPTSALLTTTPRKNTFSPRKGSVLSSTGIRIPASPRKASPMKPIMREVVMDTRKRLEGWRQTCRQQVFRCLLARRVKDAHEKYLEEKGVSLPSSSSSSPSTFVPFSLHPSFVASINYLCPLIEGSKLEQIPEEDNVARVHQGMGEFLQMAASTVTSLPKGVEEALNELRSPEKKSLSSRGVPLSPIKFAAKPKAMTLLEKIKAKEAAAKLAASRRNPELDAKISDLVLLEHKIMRIIFNIYRFNSRTSMETKKMAEQVASSGRISEDEMRSLISRLPSIVPLQFSISRTTIGEFLKVADNSVNCESKVLEHLQGELAKCKAQQSAAAAPTPRAP